MNILSASDATKILLPIIIEIMEEKVIETITYIKSISKKKPSVNRIETLKICDENVWSIENLPNLLQDMCSKGLIELADDSYKIKQTKEPKLVEEIPAELTNQYTPFFESDTLVFPESPKSTESLFLRKSLSTPELPSAQPPTPKRTVKHPGDKCTHNLVLFQSLLKEMEEINGLQNRLSESLKDLKWHFKTFLGKTI